MTVVAVGHAAELLGVLAALLVDDGVAGLLGVVRALLLVGGVAALLRLLGALLRIRHGALGLLGHVAVGTSIFWRI